MDRFGEKKEEEGGESDPLGSFIITPAGENERSAGKIGMSLQLIKTLTSSRKRFLLSRILYVVLFFYVNKLACN